MRLNLDFYFSRKLELYTENVIYWAVFDVPDIFVTKEMRDNDLGAKQIPGPPGDLFS